MKTEIETELGMIISEQTVRLRLHEASFKCSVAGKKPHVDKANRAKRIQYAKRCRDKPLGFWDQVLWIDKSKFNLFESDGKLMVWRITSEALDSKCTFPVIKHGEGNVKCWHCMSSLGIENLVFIDQHMAEQVYRDILQKIYLILLKI